MQFFRSLGHKRTKLGPKNQKKKEVQKNPILLFRVLEILTDLQFASRPFHWFQLMQKTSGCVYAQVVGARCKKKHLGVKNWKKNHAMNFRNSII